MTKTEIKNKLNELSELYGIKKNYFAEFLNIKSNSFYTYLNSQDGKLAKSKERKLIRIILQKEKEEELKNQDIYNDIMDY